MRHRVVRDVLGGSGRIPPVSLMTTKELALYLNIPDMTIKAWRSRRTGPPYIRINGALIRYDRRAVDRWLETQTVTPG